jgi:hypothetical protein
MFNYVIFTTPPKSDTLRPRRVGGNAVDGKQGSGPPKPGCEASCRRLHGTEVVIAVSQTILSWHRAD